MNEFQIGEHMKLIYDNFSDDYINILSVPEGATRRLCQIRLLQIELQTRNRLESLDKLNKLKSKLREEEDKFTKLEQSNEQHEKNKQEREHKMSQYNKETAYYKKKSKENEKEMRNLELKEEEYSDMKNQLKKLNEELEQVLESLREFKSFEPTNESLKAKIDDLKHSRISLSELTLIDEN